MNGWITTLRNAAYLVPLCGLFWLSNMLVHEFGHVLTALATGGRLELVDVRPWAFSTTLVLPNPAPSAVVWGGFLFGWAVPLITIPFWGYKRWRLGNLLQIWASACWLSMGLYLALAGSESLSDTGQLISLGWSMPGLAAAGGAVSLAGYFLGRPAVGWLAEGLRLRSAERFEIAWAWGVLLLWWAGQGWIASRF